MRGSGATLAEAFAGATTAMTSVIGNLRSGCDLERIVDRHAVTVECAAPDDGLLLVDWLDALIRNMATRHMLFSRFDASIESHHPTATA
ncbi:MAG: archease [Azonexus sp.]|nr:archease [Azonexus sp.]